MVTIIRRFRLLGFNAIRVPFSMTSLFKTPPRNFYGACQTTPDATLLAATTRPGISTPCECFTLPVAKQHHLVLLLVAFPCCLGLVCSMFLHLSVFASMQQSL